MNSKIAIRADFKVHFGDQNNVVFYSEDQHFLLQNAIFVEIVRQVKQSVVSPNEIINNLSSLFPSSSVRKALDMMMGKFLIESNIKNFSETTIAFWYAHGIGPTILEIQQEKIALRIKKFGDVNQESLDSLTQALNNLGFRTDENGDFTVVVLENYLGHDHNDFKELIRDQKNWLPVRTRGNKFWIGPIFCAESTFCWKCLERSLKENLRVQVDLFGSASENLGKPSNSYIKANEEMAFNLCGLQIAKWLANPTDHQLINHIFTFDGLKLAGDLHRVGLVFCKDCQELKNENSYHQLKDSDKKIKDSSGSRSASYEETIEVLKVIESPITGIIPTLKSFEVNGTWVVCANQNFPLVSEKGEFEEKSLRIPNVVVGKGGSKIQAKIGCYAEAVERYNSTYSNQSCVYSTQEKLDRRAYSPDELLLFSKKQYAIRDEINRNVGHFNFIPRQYDGSAINWSRLSSLSGDDFVYMPTSYCYMNYHNQAEVAMCPGDSNGNASGNSIEEALVYALLELIERDAVAIWWYNRVEYPSIDITSVSDPQILKLVRKHLENGRNAYLLDITTDLRIPTFAAISVDCDGNRIYFGTASNLDPTVAMTRAFLELNQIMTREMVDKNFTFSKFQGNERDLAKWIANENIGTHPHLQDSKKISFDLNKYQIFASDNFKEEILFLDALLKKNHLHCYWCNLSNLNIPFYTVKVVVPGLRHFWRRLAPGRLYEVPVKMGLQTNIISEGDLNPISYFL